MHHISFTDKIFFPRTNGRHRLSVCSVVEIELGLILV